MSNHKARVISLQPFYTGSHKQFIDGWISHSQLNWQQIALPGRHWKWRMRHAAIEFAQQFDSCWSDGERWDAILCTDMLNLAEFKGLLKTDAKKLPTIVYFHENQFEYPNQQDQPRDLHFAFTNLTTALAADAVWFNSDFNLQSLIHGIETGLKHWPDYPPLDAVEQIKSKSKVFYPGVSVPDNFAKPNLNDDKPLHIVWAGRWEHDKNPERMLQILDGLDGKLDMKLSVIGEQFAEQPPAFEKIKSKFATRIINWGYQEDRDKYFSILHSADLFLSSANHEFFGLSAVEAIACGCIPMLPDRLAYPELFNVTEFPERRCFLFDSVEDAVQKIVQFSKMGFDDSICVQLFNDIRERFNWSHCASLMDLEIKSLV